ncbi:unnamed protein product [Cylicostephanus goldi]|uniref:Uncharacterized protein n=1 Tax=Cylicostephanus goldi TaxID=71465 RepID=A0A3P7PJ64_CYLGO|nr:unnamed protein product [Cylicostephanus goldi]
MLPTFNFSGNVVLADYIIWNATVENYSVSSSDLAFEHLAGGVDLKMKGLAFLANANVELVINLPWQRSTMLGNVT